MFYLICLQIFHSERSPKTAALLQLLFCSLFRAEPTTQIIWQRIRIRTCANTGSDKQILSFVQIFDLCLGKWIRLMTLLHPTPSPYQPLSLAGHAWASEVPGPGIQVCEEIQFSRWTLSQELYLDQRGYQLRAIRVCNPKGILNENIVFQR